MTTTHTEADILDRLHAQLIRGTDPVSDAVLADAVSEIERLRAHPDMWPRFEQRFTELDDVRQDESLPIWQRAEAEARRAELARTWDLVARAEAVSGCSHQGDLRCTACDDRARARAEQ